MGSRKHNTKWLEKRINFISSMQTTELYIWIVHIVLYLPMLYVSMFHIPRLSGILTSWNIFVVNLGIKFVPQILIQFFISHSLTYLISWIFRWERERIAFRELILNIFTLNMRQRKSYILYSDLCSISNFITGFLDIVECIIAVSKYWYIIIHALLFTSCN